jgi:hypothetical protein
MVLAQATREFSEEQLTAQAARHGFLDSHGKPLTRWERTTLRLMSDGKVLEKRDVQFQPDAYDPLGRKYSYGWKVYGTMKPGRGAEQFEAIYAAPTKSGKPSPWTVTRVLPTAA